MEAAQAWEDERGHGQQEVENKGGDNGKWVPAMPCARQNTSTLVHLIFSTAYEVDIISLILQEKKQVWRRKQTGRSRFLQLMFICKGHVHYYLPYATPFYNCAWDCTSKYNCFLLLTWKYTSM